MEQFRKVSSRNTDSHAQRSDFKQPTYFQPNYTYAQSPSIAHGSRPSRHSIGSPTELHQRFLPSSGYQPTAGSSQKSSPLQTGYIDGLYSTKASSRPSESHYPFSPDHYQGIQLDENGRVVGTSLSLTTPPTPSGPSYQGDFQKYSHQETPAHLPFEPQSSSLTRPYQSRHSSLGLGQPVSYLQSLSSAQSQSRKRHSLPAPSVAPLPEDGGPIPDGKVMDDPHAIDAHDLFWAKTITPEFHSVVERKRKENKIDSYNPFATFNQWNACAVYERKNKHTLPQYKVRKLADGTRGILKYAVESKVPEHLRCLPSSELLNSCYDCGQRGEHAATCEFHREVGDESYVPVSGDPENRKRRCVGGGGSNTFAADYNYKDPSENKEDHFVTKAWDTVKWNVVKRPIMAMRARRRR
ncbi:hypothetical protein BKA91DRAFT_164034 [Yarrowia lipolytica]|nr:hypothetical protein BKA91DRAFT_164034 [Yarrowia lipolytica]KAE8169752.1 hypothetical protein BKA90DRAFT_159012 [Yarrowia lipolytica]RMI97542.1 hypothetical protein BD777DRAFT_158777 [Yarrowia lipolytica]